MSLQNLFVQNACCTPTGYFQTIGNSITVGGLYRESAKKLGWKEAFWIPDVDISASVQSRPGERSSLYVVLTTLQGFSPAHRKNDDLSITEKRLFSFNGKPIVLSDVDRRLLSRYAEKLLPPGCGSSSGGACSPIEIEIPNGRRLSEKGHALIVDRAARRALFRHLENISEDDNVRWGAPIDQVVQASIVGSDLYETPLRSVNHLCSSVYKYAASDKFKLHLKNCHGEPVSVSVVMWDRERLEATLCRDNKGASVFNLPGDGCGDSELFVPINLQNLFDKEDKSRNYRFMMIVGEKNTLTEEWAQAFEKYLQPIGKTVTMPKLPNDKKWGAITLRTKFYDDGPLIDCGLENVD